LREVTTEFKKHGIRVSIFVDPDARMVEGAAAVGADRVELYTEAYARQYTELSPAEAIAPYLVAAEEARKCGLGLNAGHDLSLENIEYFAKQIPWLNEVSIGHALISESLYLGLENVVGMYLRKLQNR